MAQMKNIDYSVVGNYLMITIDLSKEYGESMSGKSVIVASTGGAKQIPDYPEIKFNCSVWK